MNGVRGGAGFAVARRVLGYRLARSAGPNLISPGCVPSPTSLPGTAAAVLAGHVYLLRTSARRGRRRHSGRAYPPRHAPRLGPATRLPRPPPRFRPRRPTRGSPGFHLPRDRIRSFGRGRSRSTWIRYTAISVARWSRVRWARCRRAHGKAVIRPTPCPPGKGLLASLLASGVIRPTAAGRRSPLRPPPTAPPSSPRGLGARVPTPPDPPFLQTPPDGDLPFLLAVV